MSKYNIKCITWNKEQKEIFVTSDSKVWPCCNYTSAELNPNDRNNLDDDPYVANLRKTDPNSTKLLRKFHEAPSSIFVFA